MLVDKKHQQRLQAEQLLLAFGDSFIAEVKGQTPYVTIKASGASNVPG